MTTTRIVVGTRDELAGISLGTANVWERPGYSGLSVVFKLPDQEFIAAVDTRFSLAGVSYRLAAIEPYPPTNGYVLVVEEVVDTPGHTDSALHPADPIRISPYSGSGLATVCRHLTPELLAVLHLRHIAPIVQRWHRETSDDFIVEWTGARLGPNTTSRQIAVLDFAATPTPHLDTEAIVTLETTRWSEDTIAFAEVRADWRVGDVRASCSGRGNGLDPITDAFLRGSEQAVAILKNTLIGTS